MVLLEPPRLAFRLDPHLTAVREELEAFGFQFEVEVKTKAAPGPIESAFIKCGTRVNLLRPGLPVWMAGHIPRRQSVRVRLEIDTDPPPYAEYDVLTKFLPLPRPKSGSTTCPP